jgi:hypothetical protein
MVIIRYTEDRIKMSQKYNPFHAAECSWETNTRSVKQEIPRSLRNLKGHHRVHKTR